MSFLKNKCCFILSSVSICDDILGLIEDAIDLFQPESNQHRDIIVSTTRLVPASSPSSPLVVRRLGASLLTTCSEQLGWALRRQQVH